VLKIASGWEIYAERGPEWLFIRIVAPDEDNLDAVSADHLELASYVWDVLEQHFTYRVVLELNAAGPLRRHLVGRLVKLHKRAHSHNGMLRLAGLADSNYNVIQTLQLHGRFPQYRSREDAVMGKPDRPNKPR